MEIIGNNLGAKRGKLNSIAKNVIINAIRYITGSDMFPQQSIQWK
jgi:hypothetical protein